MAKQTFTAGQTLTAAQMNDLQTNDFNWSVSTQTANYTLQAADKGTREVMNMSAAGTVTVPNSTFAAGDIVWVHSIGSGTISVVAGSGLTLNSSVGTAPTLAQWEGGVVYFTSASAAIFFRGGSTYGVGTGGTALSTPPTGYSGVAFTATGTFTVTRAGLFEVLVCAGGGGGGGNDASAFSQSGGGGGAGGILQSTIYLDANVTVTIGGGGSGAVGATSLSTSGSSSSIGGARGVSVAGGGSGGDLGFTVNLVKYGQPGGSGGGGFNSTSLVSRTGGVSMAPSVSGFAGGDGANSNTAGQGAGGGGGATAVGGNAATTTGGAGGAGYDVSAFIGGSSLIKCAGGGGGGTTGGAGGSSGIGGAGGSNANGTAAAANTASGGGGGGTTGANNRNGGNGGSGIVYIRWKV